MNIVIKILEILDIFFQRGPQGLIVSDGKSANPYLDVLTKKVLDTYENMENYTFLEVIEKSLEVVKDNIGTITKNFEYYLKPMIDKNSDEKINPILNKLSESYPDTFLNASKWFLSTQKNLSDFSNESESILFIHDELIADEAVIVELKLSDVISIPDMIISRIMKLDPSKFEKYFKAWTLNFSSLIESKFKRIIAFLYFFWKLEEKQEVSLNKLENKTIGYFLKELNTQKKYHNIDRFRVYRNKAFHSNIKFINDENWENRRVRLRRNINLSITEFIFDYGKLFHFINSFILMVFIIAMKIEVKGKSAIDRMIDGLIKNEKIN